MNMSFQDLVHCHKVLSSDIEECQVLLEGTTGGRAARLGKRIEDDMRVKARIELVTGVQPEYAVVEDD